MYRVDYHSQTLLSVTTSRCLKVLFNSLEHVHCIPAYHFADPVEYVDPPVSLCTYYAVHSIAHEAGILAITGQIAIK